MLRPARVLSHVLWIVVVLVAARPASASTIVWNVAATVTFASPGWAGVMPVGAPLNLAITFDNTKVVDCGLGTSGIYPISAVTVQYAGVTHTGAGNVGGVEVNSLGGSCTPSGFVEFRMFGNFSASFPGLLPQWHQIVFDPNNLNMAAATLEGVLAGANGGVGWAYENASVVNAGANVFQFQVDSIQAVPEPATLVTVSSALLALLVRRRRKRHQGLPL